MTLTHTSSRPLGMASEQRDGAPSNDTTWTSATELVTAPMAMPEQSLHERGNRDTHRRRRRARQDLPSRAILLCVVLLSLASASAFAIGLWDALSLDNGGSWSHYIFLGVSVATFAWVAFGAANALVGAIVLLTGRGRDTLTPPPASTPLRARTALLFPVYHEDPEEIARAIRTLSSALERADVTNAFDVFILSDSRTEEARAVEQRTFGELIEALAPTMRVAYRNRSANVGKKAGNVADWVRTFGGAYPHFIVFDADSVMTAETVIRLSAAMQAHPGTGLIQTVPRLIGATTWFGKLQAFANNLFAPVAAAGFAAWQDTSGNYWGHNAIIRTRAFAMAAGLPSLPGPKPFGGHIQSHDFVEAAFLRRAGWRVALVTSLEGSFEGAPPTLFDIAVRDRRWMQGNLQHLAVILGRGLTPISRMHLGIGIFAYLSSALWAAMILTGLHLIWREDQRQVTYFTDEKTLFPNWPVFDPELGLSLLAATLVAVFLPKLLGLGVELIRNSARRTSWMQTTDLVRMWVLELVFSALIAPVHMLMQVRSLLQIARGQDSGWNPQDRIGARVPLRTSVRFHAWHMAVGVAIGAFCFAHSWYALAWISPIIAGLILSPLLTTWSSGPAPAPRSAAPVDADTHNGALAVAT